MSDNDSARFYIRVFNPENLLEELNYGSYPTERIRDNYIYKYLCKFLNCTTYGGHVAKTMVVEKKYLSESFLHDFKNYYAESFNSYHKFTKRIHFFSETIEDIAHLRSLILSDENDTSLQGKNVDFLEKNYIGYSVIKPIANAFLGATFLKPYDNLKGLRHYNSVRKMKINFFGRTLEISGCAFQQQDRAVSACATSALWTALYIANNIFKTLSLSPSYITKSAGLSDEKRLFPNMSLNTEQIVKALSNVGLVAEVRFKEDLNPILTNSQLKRIVYAYNKVRIPILFGYTLNHSKENHLVAIVGFRFEEGKTDSFNGIDGLNLVADKIDAFYTHNDQVGPYAKVKLGEKGYKLLTCNIGNSYLIKAKSKTIIIPLIDSIRVKYEDVVKSVSEISKVLHAAISIKNYFTKNVLDFELEWDIRLERSNDYKHNILNDPTVDKDLKIKVSESSYPRFIWLCSVMKCTIDPANQEILKEKVFDILYDPTDVPSGFCCLQANYYDLGIIATFIKSLSDFLDEDTENEFSVINKNHLNFFRDASLGEEEYFLDKIRQFKSTTI